MRPLGLMNIDSYFDEVYTEDYNNQLLQRSFWRLYGRIPLIASIYAIEQFLYAKEYRDFEPLYPSIPMIDLSNADKMDSVYSGEAGLFIDYNNFYSFIDSDYVLYNDLVDRLDHLNEINKIIYKNNDENHFIYFTNCIINQVFYKLYNITGPASYNSYFDGHYGEGFENKLLVNLLKYSKENADDYYYIPDEVEKFIDNDWKNLPNSFESTDHDIKTILDLNFLDIESYPILSGARRGSDFAANLDSEMESIIGSVISGLSIDFRSLEYGIQPMIGPGIIKYNSFTYFVGGIEADVKLYKTAPLKLENLKPFSDIFVFNNPIQVSGMTYSDLLYDTPFSFENTPFGGGFNIIPTFDYNEASYGYETVQDKGEFICSATPIKRSYTFVDYDKIILNGVSPASDTRVFVHVVNHLDDYQSIPIYNDLIIPYNKVIISIFNTITSNYTEATPFGYNLIEMNDETLSDIAGYWYILEVFDSDTGFPLIAEVEPNGSYLLYTRDGQTSDEILFLTNEYGFIIFGCESNIDITNISVNIIGD